MDSEIEKEFDNFDKYNAWGAIYQEIKGEAAKTAMDEEFTTTEARKPVNRNKNRYRDVSPYDHARIQLQTNVYINASLVEVVEADRRYILTQGPLELTTGHFWQMVWEQKSKAVLMLNKLVENGVKKCFPYFPIAGKETEEMVLEEVGLKVTWVQESQQDSYILRTLELESLETGESREIHHYNYTRWPDFGVPQSPLAFLNFLMAVRQSGALDKDVGPVVVHCSAGIGRSGTFCLVDSSLVVIEKNQEMNTLDIRSLLLDMRTCRMGLIQTADQLRFSYLAIIEGGKLMLSNENSPLSIISDYLEDQDKDYKTEEPPPPPQRTTSLGTSTSREPPPLPPRVTPMEKLDKVEEPDKENMKENGERLPSEDMADHLIKENEKDEQVQLRRRHREDRKKNTQEQINRMKEKQRKSELWKKRRSYLQPVAIGITLLIGGLLLYKLCFSNHQ